MHILLLHEYINEMLLKKDNLDLDILVNIDVNIP